MKKVYFVKYGMYLQQEAKKVEVTFDPKEYTEEEVIGLLEKDAYYESLEIAENFVGLHGFCPEEDDEEEIREAVEEAAEYYVEPWNEDEHVGYCTYGNEDEPDTEYINY